MPKRGCPAAKKSHAAASASASASGGSATHRVPPPSIKLTRRIGEMLHTAASETEILSDGDNVSADGVAKFVGKMNAIVVMLQRAHVKRVWHGESDATGRLEHFKVQLQDSDGANMNAPFEAFMTRSGNDEFDPLAGFPDAYDVDEEPTFCIGSEDSDFFVDQPTVKTITTGTTIDWGSTSFGKFIIDGADPEHPEMRSYRHIPGDECVSQVLLGRTWD